MQSQKKNIDKFVDMVRSKITEIERNKLIAIITIEQHAWKVLGRLVEKGVSDVNDFEWMQ